MWSYYRWIAFSKTAEGVLPHWISTSGRFSSIRLDGSMQVNSNRPKWRFSLILFLYDLTSCGSLEARDEFYRGLSRLI